MDFSQNGYSNEHILHLLKSSTRIVYYEYTLETESGDLFDVSITDGRISFDSNADVMRTFSGTMKKTEYMNVDTVEAKLTPWFCLKLVNGNVLKWALGKFIISGNANCENGYETVSIIGYDNAKVSYDEGMIERTYFPANTNYTSAISQLLGEVYISYNVDDTTLVMENAIEWDIGTKRIDIINTLLKAINYNDLWFDEYGVGQCNEFEFSKLREVDVEYQADKTSIILDGISKQSNKFEIPNKFVRYTEDADSAYYISVYVNDDETDPYSTVMRGRVITDIDSVDDIASQNALDTYVRKIAQEKRQAVDTVTLRTLNMPCHGYRNCIFLTCDQYEIAGKYIETAWEMELVIGGEMTHTLQKASEL